MEHALWHVSEDDSIRRFEPRDGKVWAIDTWHLPLYWFPRDCPRACWWAKDDTIGEDVERWLGGDRMRRVHAIESSWLDRMRTARVVAYRMPDRTFEPWDKFFISSEPVEPLELVELGDLLARHADAGIELRVMPSLYPSWDDVIRTTLEYSGIRLRNAVHP